MTNNAATATSGSGTVVPAGGKSGGTTGTAGTTKPAATGGGQSGAAVTPATGGTTAPAGGGSTATAGTTVSGAGAVTTAGTSSGGATATAGGTAAAGATAAAGSSGGTSTMPGSCGPESMLSATDLGDPMKRGPFTPTMKASSGPSGSSTLFYPMELGMGGIKHPVFHWGCGAGSQPSQYADHLNLLASHGFVIIANASGSNPSKASLDWILAENDKQGSMFYQKLDPQRVGIGGHSLGALETFSSAADPRITLYVLVCGGCMSGNGGCGAKDFHAPSIFLGGEGEGGTKNFEGDYAEVSMAPSVFVTKTDTDHIYCARNNLAPWVAFMRWQWCGDQKYKKEFDPGGTYCSSPWLDCKSKGF